MFKIKHVTIEGFWGQYRAEAAFHEDVNIFIGRNGSGKTTFMDLLQGALRADLRILAAHDFSAIVIRLADGSKTRTIRVNRERRDEPVDLIRFQVGSKVTRFPVYSPEMDATRHVRLRPRLAASYQELKAQITRLVRVASLSVHRAAYEQVLEEEYSPRRRGTRPAIDDRLEDLIKQFTSYQLTLAQQAASISADFQRSVLRSILYSNRFDTVDLENVGKIVLARSEQALKNAYRDLRALRPDTDAAIVAHFQAIEKGLAAVREWNEAPNKSNLHLSDILALPLLRRTDHVISLASDAEAKREKLFAPIKDFVETIGSFMTDKELSISQRGEISIRRGKQAIDVPHLSSGEKQLLILLTETLLQRNEPFVFLADEPELSLHIEWQSEVIGSIKRLNGNAQVIVATHSPEIAAGWPQRLIDMDGVVDA